MILFVRHGETQFNAENIVAGGLSDVPLNEKGFVQADNAGKSLKDTKIDLVYCSPMIRTRQTAAEILKYQNNVPVVYDERLKERSWGNCDGKPESLLPDKYWHLDTVLDESVETLDEMILRLKSVYQDILSLHKDKTILVVAHNGVGRVSRLIFNGLPESRDLDDYTLNNAEVCKLTD